MTETTDFNSLPEHFFVGTIIWLYGFIFDFYFFMEQPISVNDELQELKKTIKELGFIIIKMEKAGNGNMSAFKMIYKKEHEESLRETFFWRHDTESLLRFLLQST